MERIPCIEIENVSKKYRGATEDSLSYVSIQINQSDIFGLLGPNGAGKTTLISILCGIIPASSGEIRFYDHGRELTSLEKRNVIGYVPQDFAFYHELTPRQNLDYFGAMYNLSPNHLKQRREELLEVLGLARFGDQKVGTFSGGMKRRVNLAIGIIHKPKILFLDEPTVGVDVQSKNAIISYLEYLNSLGTTMIYTSHHMAEAEEFCKSIVLVDGGKVIANGPLTSLMQMHQSTSLQSLFIKLTGEAYRD
jgi:ABC-2 type transport system ATP-binding protein